MKKMIMILMALIVSMTTTLFADSYVAFTNKEGLALYNGYDQTDFNTWVKSRFEAGTNDCTEKEKKNATLIIVVDDQRAIRTVWVDIDVKNPKLYWVYTIDFDKNGVPIKETFEAFKVETDLKTDPVTVGLSFIKEKVFQVNNIDKGKVVYSSFAVEPVVEEQ